jgi:hypothetical protein
LTCAVEFINSVPAAGRCEIAGRRAAETVILIDGGKAKSESKGWGMAVALALQPSAEKLLVSGLAQSRSNSLRWKLPSLPAGLSDQD